MYLAGHTSLQMVIVGDAGCVTSQQIGRERKSVAPVQPHQRSGGRGHHSSTRTIANVLE